MAFLLSFIIATTSAKLDEEFFKSVSNSPLVNNPFFAKMISLLDSFTEDGIEVGYYYTKGYICNNVGNLQCKQDTPRENPLAGMPLPHCFGQGVIDCTSVCPGTEEDLNMFLAADFLTALMDINHDDMLGATMRKLKLPNSKEKGEVKKISENSKLISRFMESISRCPTFSASTLALMSRTFGSDHYNNSLSLSSLSSPPQNASTACSIRNMTCHKFPTKVECEGISVSRCESRNDLLSNLLKLPVLIITFLYVFIVTLVSFLLSYWFYTHIEETRQTIGNVETNNGIEMEKM